MLPDVESALYERFNEEEVCAFDNQGVESSITTFVNKDAAHAEGFLVLHCGACGACSNWHNLRLEWATRNYLASEAAVCAKKSIGGGRLSVYDCLQEAPLDFGPDCAEAWTDNIICTRNNCAFIYIQSLVSVALFIELLCSSHVTTVNFLVLSSFHTFPPDHQ